MHYNCSLVHKNTNGQNVLYKQHERESARHEMSTARQKQVVSCEPKTSQEKRQSEQRI
jgi:hypothetical protein